MTLVSQGKPPWPDLDLETFARSRMGDQRDQPWWDLAWRPERRGSSPFLHRRHTYRLEVGNHSRGDTARFMSTSGSLCEPAVMWKVGRAAREREKLMRGRPQLEVHFSRSQTAASLWDYAEDELADRALQMSDVDLERIQAIAAHYENPSYSLPVEGQRITHNHVSALAAITYFEGHLRPLARNRRRPEKDRPERFTPVPLPPDHGLPRD